MNFKQNKIFIVLIIVLIFVSTIFLSGCNNKEISDSHAQKGAAGSVRKIESLPYIARYTRLTYSHYMDIIADNYSISTVAIEYSTYKNFDQNNKAQEMSGLAMNAFINANGDLFNAHTTYKGVYQYFNLVGEFQKLHLKHTFSSSEVNDLIFDYLEEGDNEDYFFDGSEYTGLPIPYEHEGGSFGECEGDKYVIISFREPGTNHDRWAIYKSMFADDPHPILQGLIDILEDDFIAQFE